MLCCWVGWVALSVSVLLDEQQVESGGFTLPSQRHLEYRRVHEWDAGFLLRCRFDFSVCLIPSLTNK